VDAALLVARSRSFSSLWLMKKPDSPMSALLTDISTGAQSGSNIWRSIRWASSALKDGDTALAEAAAICAYVAEVYPRRNLAPPLGDPSVHDISTGCSSARAASSRRWSDRDQDRDESGRAGGGRQRASTCSQRATERPWILGETFRPLTS